MRLTAGTGVFARIDHSVRRVRQSARGWVVENDFYELLGFKGPMQGYHEKQCFVALDSR